MNEQTMRAMIEEVMKEPMERLLALQARVEKLTKEVEWYEQALMQKQLDFEVDYLPFGKLSGDLPLDVISGVSRSDTNDIPSPFDD